MTALGSPYERTLPLREAGALAPPPSRRWFRSLRRAVLAALEKRDA